MLLKSLHGCIHVNREGNDNIQADDHAKIVKNDEEVSDKVIAALDIDAHCYDHVPIVHHNEHKERDQRRHQVVKVHEIVVVGD